MATFTNRLMGEVIENPEGQERDVELLLTRLLHTLIEEQQHLMPKESKALHKKIPNELPNSFNSNTPDLNLLGPDKKPDTLKEVPLSPSSTSPEVK